MDYFNISDARPMRFQSFGMDELLPVSNSDFFPVRWKRNSGLKCNLHAVMIVSCVLLESGLCFKYAQNKRLLFYGFDVAIAMYA